MHDVAADAPAKEAVNVCMNPKRHDRSATVGNAIDRLWLGGVADFVLLHAYGWSWYVFNVADAAIVAGVAGLLYELLGGESQ